MSNARKLSKFTANQRPVIYCVQREKATQQNRPSLRRSINARFMQIVLKIHKLQFNVSLACNYCKLINFRFVLATKTSHF
jgi:hypothetical protein